MNFRRILNTIEKNGEHYLARTRAEYFRTLKAAGGAGAITTGTVVLKFLISASRFSLAAEGLLCCVNYAGSFLLMQGLGFRLATKQPSLLAVTLTRRLSPVGIRKRIIAICRSQFAATLGNFGLVVLATMAFYDLQMAVSGTRLLSAEKAVHTIESMDPFSTGTLAYAALTGALLWAASLVSGWVGHKIRGRHAAGAGFNVSLACILAAVPLLGKALRLPLDVRHFTLSSGALTLATCTLGFQGAWEAGLGRAMVGIACIGVLNFSVSFLISFVGAAVTRRVPWSRIMSGLRDTAWEFARAPFFFLFPIPEQLALNQAE